MIVLYPGYSFHSLLSELEEAESSELMVAYTAAFHPAIIKHFGKTPKFETASSLTPDNMHGLIIVPECCESYLPADFAEGDLDDVIVIRHLKSRHEIVEEVIRRCEIENNFRDEFVDDFYTFGVANLLITLLAQHLHYLDIIDESALLQPLIKIIDIEIESAKNKLEHADDPLDQNGESTTAVTIREQFKEAYDHICTTKENYYPSSMYLVELVLVVRSTLGESFRRLLVERGGWNLFLSSGLLDVLPDVAAETFSELRRAADSGKINFIADDISDQPLLLLPILDAADKILQGVSIYRDRLSISPTIYGRQKSGLAPFLPQILKLAGFSGVIYFSPLDGWHLSNRNHSKMVWQGVDGTKIDALARYPMGNTSSRNFFNFAEHYSEFINVDNIPTTAFAAFPVDKAIQTKQNIVSNNPDEADNVDANVDANNATDIDTDADADGVDDADAEKIAKKDEQNNSTNCEVIDWCRALRRISEFAPQLTDYVSLKSYFESTAQIGEPEFFSYESYSAGEPVNIQFWLQIYRNSVTRVVKSALETAAQLLGQKLSGDHITDFISATEFQKSEKIDSKNRVNIPNDVKLQSGILVLNAWNFTRRAFVDVSDFGELPEVISPIVYAGVNYCNEKESEIFFDNKNKNNSEDSYLKRLEIVVDVPPLGYVFIANPNPRAAILDNDKFDNDKKEERVVLSHNSSNSISPKNAGSPKKSGVLNFFAKLFHVDRSKRLITKLEDNAAYILQNEFFVARIDSDTGMLRSIFTSGYRHNQLSQQLGFRLPKSLREIDPRPANDPNRGYASPVVDAVWIEMDGEVTGCLKFRGRLICEDGMEIAKFTESATIRKFSRILEFNFSIEPTKGQWLDWFAKNYNNSDTNNSNENQNNNTNTNNPKDQSSWDSYFAIRSAWNDRSLELRGCLGDGVYYAPNSNRILSPRFVDLRGERHSLTFFSEGLPFHRRFGERHLDTILIARGELDFNNDNNVNNDNIDNNNDRKLDIIETINDPSANDAFPKNAKPNESQDTNESGKFVYRFRYGVGVDIRHPVASSFEFMLPKRELQIPVTILKKIADDENTIPPNKIAANKSSATKITANKQKTKPKSISSWFFRIDSPNIIVLYWQPIFVKDDNKFNKNDGTKKSGKLNANDAMKVADGGQVSVGLDAKPIGFKVFLLETEGAATKSVLRSFRQVKRSFSTNLLDEELQQMTITEAGIKIELHPNELLPLTAYF
ncbi:MAG: hypothetical protein LBQ66_12525 [Planctomycetaceae bacterium]|jgi:hypothetical protein|nr:hypothetical protein [Planctomycetaceae bacterium]